MKKIKKFLIIFSLIIISLLLQGNLLAATTNNKNENNSETKVDTQYFDKIKEKRKEEELEKSGYTETDYSLFGKTTKQKIYDYVHISKKYQIICIVEGILLLAGLIITILVKDISRSTKVCVAIALLAVATFVFQYFVEGQIINTLDIVLKVLGAALLLMSYIYIFKHDNLLMYVPICIIGSGYVAYQFGILEKYPILVLGLLAIPIILFVIGKVVLKAKEIEMIKPVKEKNEGK